jgi:hypothetical protein
MMGDFDTTHPIANQLRHIVPPPVRALQEELRGHLQTELNRQMEMANINDNETRGFLQQNGLPQSLYSITATTELPQDVWAKIEDF